MQNNKFLSIQGWILKTAIMGYSLIHFESTINYSIFNLNNQKDIS
jgi:hypothetical protein